MHLFVAFFLAMIFGSTINAAAYGKSTEDLVGVFSIQKTIKIGSSNDCFGGKDDASEPSRLLDSAYAGEQSQGLVAFSLEPKTENASSQRPINLTARIIDRQRGPPDQNGSASLSAWFLSPTRQQIARTTLHLQNTTAGGKPYDVFSGYIMMPPDSELGIWHLKNLTLVNSQGSRKLYENDQMLHPGFPAEFTLT
jgi:hypothetical protein